MTLNRSLLLKLIIILFLFPVVLLFSSMILGCFAVFWRGFENLEWTISYWGSWGISIGAFISVPIYLTVIYLLYRDQQTEINKKKSLKQIFSLRFGD